MKRTNKKGFTIVELVIVIAVIAILAAVLIPTFTNLIKKANVSSDTQLVRNLNTALTTDAALNGKHETMQDALDAVNESGFDLAKIMNTKATDNVILWDSENDIFCYLNDDVVTYIPESTSGTLLETGSYKLWKIYSNKDEMASETYSAYLTGEGWEESIAIDGKGLDVGEVASITTINYNNTTGEAKQVIIRTNSFETVLTVDAIEDEVSHFGNCNYINIIRIKMGTFEEFGNVLGSIKLAFGKVNVNAEAKVGCVLFTSLTDSNNVTVTPTEDSVLVNCENNSNVSLITSDLSASSINLSSVVSGNNNYVEYDENTVGINKNIAYTSFGDMMKNAQDGDTLTLMNNVTIGKSTVYKVSKNISLNLNSFTITKTGSTTGAAAKNAFSIENNGSLSIYNGTICSTNNVNNGSYIIYVDEGGKLTLTNINLKEAGKRMVIGTLGGNIGVDVTLNNCNVEGRMYFPANGKYTINGGNYSASYGCIYLKSGVLNITGGTFTCETTPSSTCVFKHQGDGAFWFSNTITIEACNYGGKGNPIVNITDGTFIAKTSEDGMYIGYGILVINYNENKANMSGTTVQYQLADVPENYGENYYINNDNSVTIN